MSRDRGPFLDPETVPAARHRRAARAVVADDRGRILVEQVRVHDDPVQGSWWELPGGGLEGDETTAQAAAREIVEETGYLDVEVGPALATGRVRYSSSDGVAEQHETVHACRLRGERWSPTALQGAEAAGLVEVAWSTPDELSDGRRVDPPELPQLARDVVAGRLVPRRLRDRDGLGWSDERPLPKDLPDGAVARVVGAGGAGGAVSGAGGGSVGAERWVVRDAAPWTPAVHAWLEHLHEVGVEAVPRPLGVDAYGREAVTFLPGESSAEVWPEPLRTVDGLAAVGALLARCRDAAEGPHAPPEMVWRTGPDAPAPGQTIAHGDVGHANLVWRPDGTPGLIDWEFAHPASPARDLAEAAAWLVPLTSFDHERRGFAREPDRRARLHALADAGGIRVEPLLDAVADYLAWERRRVVDLGRLGIRPFDTYLEAGQPAYFDRASAYLTDHGAHLR